MSEGENLSKHAAEASKRALEMAGLQATDIDLILLATSTPDDLFGSAGQVILSPAPSPKVLACCAHSQDQGLLYTIVGGRLKLNSGLLHGPQAAGMLSKHFAMNNQS